jgi:hypothetical protein
MRITRSVDGVAKWLLADNSLGHLSHPPAEFGAVVHCRLLKNIKPAHSYPILIGYLRVIIVGEN